MKRTMALIACALAIVASARAAAADLVQKGAFVSLAADTPAQRVGDTLTVTINENSTASNTAQGQSTKTSHFGGQVAGGSVARAGALDLGTGFSGTGQTLRSDKVIAQVSVVVDQVMPNGYLRVSGSELLKVNGERTFIEVQGLVRPQDIASDNTVPSTRLANAHINFDGAGFLAGAAKAGILTRLINWLGLP